MEWKDKKRCTENTREAKKGFMNIFFAGVCVFILMVGLSLTVEAMEGRMRRREYREMLKFDYRLEGYFLLLWSGSLEIPDGLAFGSLEGYEVLPSKAGETYITMNQEEGSILLQGYYEGKLRKTYEVAP